SPVLFHHNGQINHHDVPVLEFSFDEPTSPPPMTESFLEFDFGDLPPSMSPIQQLEFEFDEAEQNADTVSATSKLSCRTDDQIEHVAGTQVSPSVLKPPPRWLEDRIHPQHESVTPKRTTKRWSMHRRTSHGPDAEEPHPGHNTLGLPKAQQP